MHATFLKPLYKHSEDFSCKKVPDVVSNQKQWNVSAVVCCSIRKSLFFLMIFSVFFAFFSEKTFASLQQPAAASVKGRVIDKETKAPVEAAAVMIVELDVFSITDSKGSFEFFGLKPGRLTIAVQCLGMVTTQRTLQVDEMKVYSMVIELETSSLKLEEVQVTARSSRTGLSSTSEVSRAAIEHLQATSLSDVLQLIPGQLADNPDLRFANQIALRQVGTDNLNALGTAIIIDGAPLSNNANLQAANPAFSGTGGFAGSVSGRGIDLRQISTENIESIEVIRGIPSVEHGDLTAGALLIETRAGRTPYQFRARVNPLITQFNIGKGFNLGERLGSLNVDFDYLESTSDQRQTFQGYDRLTAQLTYSKRFLRDQRLHTTTTISGFTTIDETRQDPDDLRYQRARFSKDKGFRFNTTGRWNLNREFARNIRYNISMNYVHQQGFSQELLSGYVYPLSFALVDTTMAATIVPSEYLSQVTIDGKPLNVFAKLTNSFYKNILGFNNRFLVGADWRTDGNYGLGRVYDVTRPPRMGSNQASRPRSYKDIPALNQFAFYAENNIHRVINQKELAIQMGLRYDNIQPLNPFKGEYGTFLGPRFNLSYEVLKNLRLKGGYGITSKAPTLVHLYPNPAYFDLVNYNYYAPVPEERLIVVTTKVVETENKDLKIAKNTKQEIGIDYSRKNQRFTLTGFYEKLEDGYSFFNQVMFIPMELYEAIEFPPGEPPILSPVPASLDTFMTTYNRPMNTQETINQGIEFDFDFGRINAIRTSFHLNGAYILTKMYSTDYQYWINISIPRPQRIAVFPAGNGTLNRRFNTALRVIHNIPEFRFLVSLTIQTIWDQQAESIGYDYEILDAGTPSERAVQPPLAYIGKDGQWVYLTREEAMLPEYSDIRRGVSDATRITLNYPPLWLFNIRLSKDIREGFGFAFYANNMFMHRPLHYNQRTNRFDKRNSPIFFGTEMFVKF
jgi:outer membrane receptor for ferrienterochelin and colicin